MPSHPACAAFLTLTPLTSMSDPKSTCLQVSLKTIPLSDPSMTSISQRGIDLVKLAVAEDEQGNYQKAYRHYKDALDYLHLVLKGK